LFGVETAEIPAPSAKPLPLTPSRREGESVNLFVNHPLIRTAAGEFWALDPAVMTWEPS